MTINLNCLTYIWFLLISARSANKTSMLQYFSYWILMPTFTCKLTFLSSVENAWESLNRIYSGIGLIKTNKGGFQLLSCISGWCPLQLQQQTGFLLIIKPEMSSDWRHAMNDMIVAREHECWLCLMVLKLDNSIDGITHGLENSRECLRYLDAVNV